MTTTNEIEINGRKAHVANPGQDKTTFQTSLFRMWFDQYAPLFVYVWADDFETALEIAAEYIAEQGWKGYFSPPDYDDARKELGPDASEEQIAEHAETEHTYTESGWFNSYDWGGDDVTEDSEIASVREAHLETLRTLAKRHNLQVWHGTHCMCDCCDGAADDVNNIDHASDCPEDREITTHTGWLWQTCVPGCLPDSDTFGPFKTEREALEDATDGLSD